MAKCTGIRCLMQVGYKVDECNHKDCPYRTEPITNADRIRSMTDEELALWICGIYDIEEENGKFINGIIIPGYAPHDIEEWLQQPAKVSE